MYRIPTFRNFAAVTIIGTAEERKRSDIFLNIDEKSNNLRLPHVCQLPSPLVETKSDLGCTSDLPIPSQNRLLSSVFPS